MGWEDWVPDAAQEVACSGTRHRIRWSRGKLHLLDHPDLVAWRTLAVLQGERLGCFEVLRHWREGIARPEFLLEWARAKRSQDDRLATYGLEWRDWAEDEGSEAIAPLVFFTDLLLDRLALAAIARGFRSAVAEEGAWVMPATMATERRLRRALVDALVASGVPTSTAALTPFRCRLAAPGERSPRVDAAVAGGGSGSGSGTMRLTVSPWWLHRVWASGMVSTIPGHIVVDVDRERGVAVAMPVGAASRVPVECPLP